jgi:hypothetical protein
MNELSISSLLAILDLKPLTVKRVQWIVNSGTSPDMGRMVARS